MFLMISLVLVSTGHVIVEHLTNMASVKKHVIDNLRQPDSSCFAGLGVPHND